MKTNIRTSLRLAVVAACAVVQVAKADFDIGFLTAGAGNPVFDVGGSTVSLLLSGTGFKGQLYVGANAGSLTAVGTGGLTIFSASAGDLTGIRTFLTGPGAGFINGGTFSVASSTLNPGGSAVYQFRVWDTGASYEAAAATTGAKIGSSAVTSVTLGGTVPGNPPTLLTLSANTHAAFGLTTVAAVPEPATLALGIFGAAGLLFRRRK